MLELEDEQIIIASTLIALENKSALKIENLSTCVYDVSKKIGMKRFSESDFNQIFIPLVIPVLNNAGLLQINKKGSNSTYKDSDEMDQNTICKLTKTALKNMKTVRKGSRIRFGNTDQKEIFNNIFKIINGHIDEESVEDAFKRYMNKGHFIPQ